MNKKILKVGNLIANPGEKIQGNITLKMSDDNITLEERFTQLEEIVKKMEDPDVSLDESFELYKAGLDEIKNAGSMLDGMEKSMLVLNEQGELEEF